MACWCKGQCPIARNFGTLLQQGKTNEAERQIKMSLIDNPSCVQGNAALAHIFTSSNRAYAAAPHLAIATSDGPNLIVALEAANNRRQRGDLEEAANLYSQIRVSWPEDPRGWSGMIGALEALKKYADSDTVASAALARFPNDLEVIRVAAVARASQKDFAGALNLLSKEGAKLRPIDLFDYGRYAERTGDYAQAWGAWSHARAILKNQGRLNFNIERHQGNIARLLEFSTPARLAQLDAMKLPVLAPPKVQPIFVTGFPRSGTTMVETALSNHPKIHAADELTCVNDVIRIMPALMQMNVQYPALMAAADFGDNLSAMGTLRDYYLRRAEQRAGPWKNKSVKFFTDKLPMNEQHYPLIRLFRMGTPIIVVRRHPLDVMVSNYSYGLGIGWNYSASLEICATVYAGVDALLQRYLAHYGNQIHVIRYENFVADHKAAIDDALGYIGLPKDDACYDFHNNPRFSRTASQMQVKEPIYDRSIGRWHHYREQLAPAVEILRPILERDGYEH